MRVEGRQSILASGFTISKLRHPGKSKEFYINSHLQLWVISFDLWKVHNAMGFVLTYSLGRDAVLCAFGASPHGCPSHQHSRKNPHLWYLSLLCCSDTHEAVRLVYSSSILFSDHGSSVVSLYTFTFVHWRGVCVSKGKGVGDGVWVCSTLAPCVE